ncbi:NAD(P)H-hydrate dehydratase [Novosphingobium sp.]|uniref:NAD(P)H-hydrate dehydratase n=1 Tax=Novosphingobium sp. TaxID=1874826 RepID=UPI00260AFC94|nr:NAD(P)H-hydrate dehydratase [Novosphingobium sp.]
MTGHPRHSHALLTVAEMARADRLAIDAGVPGIVLMRAAGRAVADAVRARWSPCPVTVLCGPGNNGGDGFVVATQLREAGWPVTLAPLAPIEALRGDAAMAAADWTGGIVPFCPAAVAGAGLVVDAVFGAGLARPVDGVVAETLRAIRCPVVAVDVPTGVDGDDGSVRGTAVPAALTVTFFRRKPAHLLVPGRFLCGETVVADIGIPDRVLEAIAPSAAENGPDLWRDRLPVPDAAGHKFGRGHVVVWSGRRMTGAARLAARAAQRSGAGLVTVAGPEEAAAAHRPALDAIMVRSVAGPAAVARLFADRRITAAVIGPGAGRGPMTRLVVEAAAATGTTLVLDADALSVFAGDPDALARLLAGRPAVVTPHEGEFAALFGTVEGGKPARARAAAARLGAVVVLKGPDTVIAAPDGRLAINANAPADLATAGSGDVLAGVVGALAGQGADPFDAARAAVWLHGEAGRRGGSGLVADDLPALLPAAFRAARA